MSNFVTSPSQGTSATQPAPIGSTPTDVKLPGKQSYVNGVPSDFWYKLTFVFHQSLLNSLLPDGSNAEWVVNQYNLAKSIENSVTISEQ